MPLRGLAKRLAIASVAALTAVCVVELFLQGLVWLFHASGRGRYRDCGDCPHVYEPVAGRKDINSLGLRGPEVSLDRNGGVFRILVIGDSVAHGFGVAETETFARKLERRLNGKHRVEVLNAAVDGYSPFNQSRRFESHLMKLKPDLVLVQTCFNDLVDPRLHWYAWQGIQHELDHEAIPAPVSTEQARAVPAWRLFESRWLRPLILNRLLVRALIERYARGVGSAVGESVEGRFWPTYVTGELPFTIEPFLRPGSTELEWFARQHRRLLASAAQIGARVAFLIAPLAYQVEPGYPFRPQDSIARFCQAERVPCLDLLPALERDRDQHLYLQGSAGDVALLDVWHFSPRGHDVVAEAVESFLEDHALIGKAEP
jgi:lysophospholipase L1-like esterase